MIACPEVSHLVAQYESASEAKDANGNTKHHDRQNPRSGLAFAERNLSRSPLMNSLNRVLPLS
jgi:hypothetical protein